MRSGGRGRFALDCEDISVESKDCGWGVICCISRSRMIGEEDPFAEEAVLREADGGATVRAVYCLPR